MTPAERVAETAKSQVGYAAQSGKMNKYAAALDAMGDVYNGPKNGFDWCDVFADWCYIASFGADKALAMIAQPKRGAGAGCPYSAGYYRAAGQWSSVPSVGAQVFFGTGKGCETHTGIVVSVTPSTVTTVEGNTGGGAGAVNTRHYAHSNARIVGYGVPKWSLVADAQETPPEATTSPQTGGKDENVYPFATIKQGARNATVRLLQAALNVRNGASLAVDGYAGAVTIGAVKTWQRKRGLVVDGECGPITWASLLSA